MKRSSRHRARGAIFVEAIIIVSSLTFLFLSMVFFKDMYLKKLRVARLARATALAYSLQGCPEGQSAASWAGRDLDPGAGRNSPPPSNTPVVPPIPEPNGSKRAGKILTEIPGAGSNGGVINPVVDLGFTMKAGAMMRKNSLSTPKGYTQTMSSTSFVSCSEGVRDDDFKGIVGYALSKFNLFKGSEDPD